MAVKGLNPDIELNVIAQNAQKNELLTDDHSYFILNDKMMPLMFQVTVQ